jgi:hypothetical protein
VLPTFEIGALWGNCTVETEKKKNHISCQLKGWDNIKNEPCLSFLKDRASQVPGIIGAALYSWKINGFNNSWFI